jgi:hypothetical protein
MAATAADPVPRLNPIHSMAFAAKDCISYPSNRLRKNLRKTVSFRGPAKVEGVFARHFLDFCCAGGPESCRATDSWRDYTAAARSLGIRTTLYAAAASVNIHPTSAVPR